jgi:hypothetical protein
MEGTDDDSPSALDSDNCTLFNIASLLGVDLVISVDLVNCNLQLIRAQEQARVNLFHESNHSSNVTAQDPRDVVLQPKVVENILHKLIALTNDNGEDFSGLDFDSTSLLDVMDEMAKRKIGHSFPIKTPIRSVLRRKKQNNRKY